MLNRFWFGVPSVRACTTLAALIAAVALAVPPCHAANTTSRPAAASCPACPATFDQSALDGLLKRYVSRERVDYRLWKASAEDQAVLTGYISRLGSADPSGWSRDEKLAFYINAYNAITLKSVLEAYPVRSIKNIPGVWASRKWRVAGRDLTLNDIEHKILRAELQEARIHFAIVCASVGCPPLQPWAFSGAKIDQQLDSVARSFLNAPDRVRVDVERKTLVISAIFQWFPEDFVRSAGSVPAFVARYRFSSEAQALAQGRWTVSYLDYNWSLNEAAR